MDYQKYTIDKYNKLGNGAFGVVYKGRCNTNSQPVAIKQIKICSDDRGTSALKEIKAFLNLDQHKNIVKLYDYYYGEHSFWLVMECCDAGDLNAYISKAKPTMKERMRIMYQCSCALTYMHEIKSPVAHRDIKPSNILVKIMDNEAVVKVTDFGLSRIVEQTFEKMLIFQSTVGTPVFMAPEQGIQTYGFPVDVFSMGLVSLAMIQYTSGSMLIPKAAFNTGKVPIGHAMALLDKYQVTPQLVTIDPDDDSEVMELKRLISAMGRIKPQERITMRQSMEFLAKRLDIDDMEPRGPGAEMYVPQSFPDINDMSRNDMPEDTQLAGSSGDVMDSFSFVREQSTNKISFKRDDMVVVDCTPDFARKMQLNHGEWVTGMERYFGLAGRIVDDSSRGTYRVHYPDGKSLNWNAYLLQSAGSSSSTKPSDSLSQRFLDTIELFTPCDVIQICDDAEKFEECQRNIGFWRDDLVQCVNSKGIVLKVDHDGHVVINVLVNDKPVRFPAHPGVLHKLEVPAGPIKSGHWVCIKPAKHEVKSLQKACNLWNDETSAVLDHIGSYAVVKKTGQNFAELHIYDKPFHVAFEALIQF